ncbi:hypothetical protein [Clostridium sp. L74]|uniref:hypothetical protein n=1 Tax=Clostridium sp. L74 TaxID=1560217 RepID=UPI0006BEF709|nr:hypothetical protein [Clostridium sp. L74]KOR24172.1 hypothetical protein ND00_28780 [Clostridium sp. L74]
MVQISEQRFLELLQAEDKLYALEACGVDNWSGYQYIHEYQASEEELLNMVNRFSI